MHQLCEECKILRTSHVVYIDMLHTCRYPVLDSFKACVCFSHLENYRCDRMKGSELISLYIYIYMPITSFGGPLLGFKKSRSRGKDDN